MAILNERIKEMRLLRGFTLSYVADELGVKEATMQRYESGEIKNIKHEYIVKLSEIFNCSPSYLMGWEDSQLQRLSAYYVKLSESQNKLFTEYNKLNNYGKTRLLATAQEMSCNPLYNNNYQEELNAAHARTDITIPKDADVSESHVMDDENF